MSETPQQQGYTVVEALIVVAITSALITTAGIFVRGRYSDTGFNTSTRNLENKIQDIVNDTITGLSSDVGGLDLGCTVDTANANAAPSFNNDTETEQGANKHCVYLGKVVQFGVYDDPDCKSTGTPAYKNCNTIAIYPIVGRRETATGSPVTNLAQAVPIPLYPPTSNPTMIPDRSEDITLSNGLRVTQIMGTNSTNYSLLAFVLNLSGSVGSQTDVSQKLLVFGLGGTTLGKTKEAAVANTTGGIPYDMKNASASTLTVAGFSICLAGQPTGQTGRGKYAKITIGAPAVNTTAGSFTTLTFASTGSSLSCPN